MTRILPQNYHRWQALRHAVQQSKHAPAEGQAVNAAEESPDFTQLDDTALLSAREQMRAELQRLPPHSPGYAALIARYDASLDELVERARRAWTRASEGDRWTT